MEQLETPRYFKSKNKSNEVARVTVENDSIYLERTWRNRPYPAIGSKPDFFKTGIGVKFSVRRYGPQDVKLYIEDLAAIHGWIECTYEEFLRILLQCHN